MLTHFQETTKLINPAIFSKKEASFPQKMLILPKVYTTKILLDVPKKQWRSPSLAQPKDQFGNENRTRFRIRGCLPNGRVKFTAWFDDRDAFDAILYDIVRAKNGSTFPKANIGLIDEVWGDPSFEPWLSYEFATTIVITSGTSQTSPSDWNNSNNFVEGIGAGGSGGTDGSSNGDATGGGGGEYRKIVNFAVATPGTTTFNYVIAATSASVTGAATNGNDGAATTFATSSLVANGGKAGTQGTNPKSGGLGGTGGTGAADNADGGRGGNSGSLTSEATGGGGAGGPSGVGNQGVDGTIGSSATNGGSGDAGSGGSAGSSASGTGTQTAGNGGNGAELSGSVGPAGGGGGAVSTSGSATAGDGGLYGGGGGGAKTLISQSRSSGAGAQGLLVLTYTPALIVTGSWFFFN